MLCTVPSSIMKANEEPVSSASQPAITMTGTVGDQILPSNNYNTRENPQLRDGDLVESLIIHGAFVLLEPRL